MIIILITEGNRYYVSLYTAYIVSFYVFGLETSKKEAVEQKSETLPVPVTNKPKPPEKEEVDSSKANGPAHVETTPEQKTTKSTDAEPPKKAAKPSGDEMSSFLGKMFKKKSEPVKPAAENNDSVDAPVKAVDLKIDMQPVSRSCKNENLHFLRPSKM